MADQNYSGYPTRDSVPYGYSFVQFVDIFRDSGGYGSLIPQQVATFTEAATGGEKADKPGLRLAKGHNKMDMPAKGRAIGHVIANGTNSRDSKEFGAVEGDAKSEFKFRDKAAR